MFASKFALRSLHPLRSRAGNPSSTKWLRLLIAVPVILAALLWLSSYEVASQQPTERFPGEHPRLFFSSQEVPRLRQQAETTHREIWAPILDYARNLEGSSPPREPEEEDLEAYRNAGNRLIAVAFAYVITGDSSYLELTRDHLVAYSRWEHWGDERGYGDRDLGFHHILMGSAIAYDWVYTDLSEDDRVTIGENLARRAGESYEASVADHNELGNWWRVAYSQNHYWTNHSALGIAALVLEGEHPNAGRWLERAVERMRRVHTITEGIGDGTWHEGIPYQSYALTMSLPFLHNLRALKGEDLIPHTYLRNYIYWRVYNSLPGTDRFALSFADFEWSWANSYGPIGLLRFAAREYRDSHGEWMARQLLEHQGRYATEYEAPWYVFEFLYYDPDVQPRGPEELPRNRVFPDLQGVIWRTGWGEHDLVFGLKTGPPGGRFLFDSFMQQEPPWDPDAEDERLHVGHDHKDANTFYLYRGNVDLASEQAGDRQIGTEYHNTLLADGGGQYPGWPTDSYGQSQPELFLDTDARLEAAAWTSSFSYLVADATNSYRQVDRDGEGPGDRLLEKFKRYVILAKPGYLVVVDSIRSEIAREYTWISHFGSKVTLQGGWVKGISENGQVLGVSIVHPASYSRYLGSSDGKPFVRSRTASDTGEVRFVNVLYPTTETEWATRPRIFSLGDDSEVSGARVVMDGVQDHIVNHGGATETAIAEYTLRGTLASVIKDPDGNLRSLFLGGASHLADSEGSRLLIGVPSPVGAVEATYKGPWLSVHGEDLPSGIRIYAPEAAPGRIVLNGRLVEASRDGNYLVLP